MIKEKEIKQILEEIGSDHGAVEIFENEDGTLIELILERQSFGGGTRGERFVEVKIRNIVGEKERVYINKIEVRNGSFEELVLEAVKSPLFRVVEPESPFLN